jgi:GR25 family glycosyltransferase involved in LPS biosynthesis
MMKFPPIYIIKMPGSDRNPGLNQSLDKLGLKYIIQNAVVGNNLTQSELNLRVNLRGCEARLGYKISKSAIGCALSHREIYKKALGSNFEWVLIFEEDAILIDLDIDHILEIVNENYKNPVIVQLFSRSARLFNPKSKKSIGHGQREIFSFMPRIPGTGTSAYLINKSALEIALEKEVLNGPADWPDWGHKVIIKGVYPWMTSESDCESTIPVNSESRFKYVLRRISQLTLIHFLIYKKEYANLSTYISEEIIPYIFYLRWKIGGSKFYKNDRNGLQYFGPI